MLWCNNNWCRLIRDTVVQQKLFSEQQLFRDAVVQEQLFRDAVVQSGATTTL